MEGMVWASRLVRLPIRKEQHFHDYTLVSLPNATSIYPVLWSPVFLKVSANCKTRPSDFVLRLLLSGKSLQSYNREKSNVGSLGSGTQGFCLVPLSKALRDSSSVSGWKTDVSCRCNNCKATAGHYGCTMCFIFEVEYIYIYTYIFYCFFMYTIYTMCQTPSTRPLLSWQNPKHDKQLRTTRRKFKQSKWRAFVTWLAFQSNGARASAHQYPPIPHGFHGQPSSELDRCFGRCGCCQSAEGRRFNWYREVSWLDQLRVDLGHIKIMKNHQRSKVVSFLKSNTNLCNVMYTVYLHISGCWSLIIHRAESHGRTF